LDILGTYYIRDILGHIRDILGHIRDLNNEDAELACANHCHAVPRLEVHLRLYIRTY
jgi:hypothetical protein